MFFNGKPLAINSTFGTETFNMDVRIEGKVLRIEKVRDPIYHDITNEIMGKFYCYQTAVVQQFSTEQNSVRLKFPWQTYFKHPPVITVYEDPNGENFEAGAPLICNVSPYVDSETPYTCVASYTGSKSALTEKRIVITIMGILADGYSPATMEV